MGKRSSPEKLLKKIEAYTGSVHPPVEAFENSIRTTPFRILLSVLISSRTKDDVTLKASQRLFDRADTPEKIIRLGEEKVSQLIYPVGFYGRKAKNIMEISKILAGLKGIPDSFEELVSLPGVGRKTANLVLALAFDWPAIAVDTHVFRISRRLGWARGRTPEQVEFELQAIFRKDLWNRVNKTLVGFGQTVCKPIRPACPRCPIEPDCPFPFKM